VAPGAASIVTSTSALLHARFTTRIFDDILHTDFNVHA
jgi:hypothetical protein